MKNQANTSYTHIDRDVTPIALYPGVTYYFEYAESFDTEVLSFDFDIDAEVDSYSGLEESPQLKGFPLEGSYNTCAELSHLYEIRVMCGDE